MSKEHDPFAPPAAEADQQKDHELGIRVVFEYLQREGYEIQSVNTDQTKHPQIVAARKGFILFIEVRTQRGPLPELPQHIRKRLLAHAKHFDATCFFAPVALWATGERDESGNEGFYVKVRGHPALMIPNKVPNHPLSSGRSGDNKSNEGQSCPPRLDDVLIVAPYNAKVSDPSKRIPHARVGTVDKFQGPQAPVVIYSLTTSSSEDARAEWNFFTA